jgi:uncharacterized protein (TIGR00730 family)
MSQNNRKVIAVFGWSRPIENSAEYIEAYAVGKLLAQKGFVVMNGGYAGTMEASARGAREHGGRSIGILSDEFQHLAPNPYLDETASSPDLFSRIREMQTRADGFIVLKGSMGTLAELSLVWNLAKLDTKHRKPIILVGENWSKVLRGWCEHLAVTEEEAALLQCADNPEQAVELVVKQLVIGN